MVWLWNWRFRWQRRAAHDISFTSCNDVFGSNKHHKSLRTDRLHHLRHPCLSHALVRYGQPSASSIASPCLEAHLKAFILLVTPARHGTAASAASL